MSDDNAQPEERPDEHTRRDRYVRYHRDVWLPHWVRGPAEEFLPAARTPLTPSAHYEEIAEKRQLPLSVYMPASYSIIEVAVVVETHAVYRVTIRAPWNRRVDIVLVLEGDYQIVTGFWINRGDEHRSLNKEVYEQEPVSTSLQEPTEVEEEEKGLP